VASQASSTWFFSSGWEGKLPDGKPLAVLAGTQGRDHGANRMARSAIHIQTLMIARMAGKNNLNFQQK
jgi:hypothetical protein